MNKLQKIKNYCAEHKTIYSITHARDSNNFEIKLPFNDTLRFSMHAGGSVIFDGGLLIDMHPRFISYEALKEVLDIIEDIKEIVKSDD